MQDVKDAQMSFMARSKRVNRVLFRCLPASLVLLFVLTSRPAQAVMFVTPIGGTPYEDWTIVNYVDLTPGSGTSDYLGGTYTYNGHNAIDFTLPNFAAMDAGVSVNAAAAGIVVGVHDGEYDRWSRVNPNPGEPANSVLIYHEEGLYTRYLHLKKDSISVSFGDVVTAGQQIGEVGSSGNSTDAHLHFAVEENGVSIETYLDPDRWWIDPLPYAGDVPGFLDFGITNHTPTTTELVDRPVDYDVFRQIDGPGQQAVIWANLHGFEPGDDLDIFFYQPDGTEFAHTHSTTGRIRYGWRNAGITLPDNAQLGEWQVDFQRNGATLISDSFTVVVPEPPSIVLAVLGVGFMMLSQFRRRARHITAR